VDLSDSGWDYQRSLETVCLLSKKMWRFDNVCILQEDTDDIKKIPNKKLSAYHTQFFMFFTISSIVKELFSS
jgi:hypothetical protein